MVDWRLRDDVGGPAFVEVAVIEPLRPLRLHLGPVELEVDHGTDLALLRQVVEALS